MKIYTVAKKLTEPDHGGSTNFLAIVPLGFYYSVSFPPVFKTWKQANEFMQASTISYSLKVV